MILIKHIVWIYILSSIYSTPCLGQVHNFQNSENVAIEVDRIIETKFREFNGSILVSCSDTSFIKSYGWTDFSKTRALKEESRFNVGSLAKEIPGIIILDLIIEGSLKFDDKIDQFLGDIPESIKSITIEDLLFYKSGMPILDLNTIRNDLQAKKILPSITLEIEPGSNYLYSNWNNLLQVYLIEEVLNSNYNTIVTSKYFAPLKIKNSFFGRTKNQVTHNMTKSFSNQFGNDEDGNPKFKDFQFSFGPLFMTIGDIFLWIEHIGSRYDHSGKSVRKFFRKTTMEKQGPLGIIDQEDGKILRHLHGGYAYSYGTSTYKNYKTDLTLIIMTNCNENNIIQHLEKSILKVLEN